MKTLVKKIVPLTLAIIVLSSCESRYITRFYVEYQNNENHISSIYGKEHRDNYNCMLENITYDFESLEDTPNILFMPEYVYVKESNRNLKVDCFGERYGHSAVEGEIFFRYSTPLTTELEKDIEQMSFEITIDFEKDYYNVYVYFISFFFKTSDNVYKEVYPGFQDVDVVSPPAPETSVNYK